MIKSFKDRWLEEFYYLDIPSKKIPSEIQDRVFRKLQMLDDSSSEADLRSPPSNHFEKLVGRLTGKFSIRVNKKWRLIFHLSNGGELSNIYLDKHEYR